MKTMKLLIGLVLFCMFFVSCSKSEDEIATPEQPKDTVTVVADKPAYGGFKSYAINSTKAVSLLDSICDKFSGDTYERRFMQKNKIMIVEDMSLVGKQITFTHCEVSQTNDTTNRYVKTFVVDSLHNIVVKDVVWRVSYSDANTAVRGTRWLSFSTEDPYIYMLPIDMNMSLNQYGQYKTLNFPRFYYKHPAMPGLPANYFDVPIVYEE